MHPIKPTEIGEQSFHLRKCKVEFSFESDQKMIGFRCWKFLSNAKASLDFIHVGLLKCCIC